MNLLIATRNAGKLREYQTLFDGLPLTLLTLNDVGLGEMDVEETGDTFTANAQLKAEAYAEASGMVTLADDSGLCVDALDGTPGIYSARYAGANASDADRRAKLLRELVPYPLDQRTAAFVCVIAVVNPAIGMLHLAEGSVSGQIATLVSSGSHGFGYDPIFIADGYTVTLADVPADEKNAISHRGRAAQHIRPVLEALIQTN